MKKTVLLSALLFVFSLSGMAQTKKKQPVKVAEKKETVLLTPLESGKADANAISEFLGLSETTRENFVGLFEMKHRMMQDKSATLESKKELLRVVGLKINGTISDFQQEKLNANPALLKRLLE